LSYFIPHFSEDVKSAFFVSLGQGRIIEALMKDLGGVGKIRASFPRLITDRDDIIKVFVLKKIESLGFLRGVGR
jgi:hypothetical protein